MYTVPLPNVIRQRDLFEPTVDESRDGKSRCGFLNDGRHPWGRKERYRSEGGTAHNFYISASGEPSRMATRRRAFLLWYYLHSRLVVAAQLLSSFDLLWYVQ
jgi:hypothetical protein